MVEDRLLLIVDVQKGFINPRTEHIPSMVESLQYGYRHVMATRFISLPGSLYSSLMHWNRLSPGTEDVGLAFAPKDDAVVMDKSVYTSVNDVLLDYLVGHGLRIVDVCGIDTEVCVTRTAVDLFERGYVPYVLKECCATTAKADLQDAAFEILSRYIGGDRLIEDASAYVFGSPSERPDDAGGVICRTEGESPYSAVSGASGSVAVQPLPADGGASFLDCPVERSGLSLRVGNILRRNGVCTVGQLVTYGRERLMLLPGFGGAAWREVRRCCLDRDD